VSATSQPGRPERLSLQVPQHTGGPVTRVVTPTVLVNGEDDAGRRPGSGHSTRHPSVIPSNFPTITTEDLKRALAADLLHAEISGRTKRLRGTEAKDLAEALIAHLRSRQSTGLSDHTGVGSDELFLFSCASWLGLSAPSGSPSAGVWNPVVERGIKKITVRRFRVSSDGYDSPIDDEGQEMEDVSGGKEVKETFDIEWELGLGSLSGKFAVKGLTMPELIKSAATVGSVDKDGEEGSPSSTVGDENSLDAWKTKYETLQRKFKVKNEEFRALRDSVLEAVL